MTDMLDSAKDKLDEMTDKAHELKGQAEQKHKDMKEEKAEDNPYMAS